MCVCVCVNKITMCQILGEFKKDITTCNIYIYLILFFNMLCILLQKNIKFLFHQLKKKILFHQLQKTRTKVLLSVSICTHINTRNYKETITY
jgi:hypothetical protein